MNSCQACHLTNTASGPIQAQNCSLTFMDVDFIPTIYAHKNENPSICIYWKITSYLKATQANLEKPNYLQHHWKLSQIVWSSLQGHEAQTRVNIRWIFQMPSKLKTKKKHQMSCAIIGRKGQVGRQQRSARTFYCMRKFPQIVFNYENSSTALARSHNVIEQKVIAS